MCIFAWQLTWRCCSLDAAPAWDSSFPAGLACLLLLDLPPCSRLARTACTSPGGLLWRPHCSLVTVDHLGTSGVVGHLCRLLSSCYQAAAPCSYLQAASCCYTLPAEPQTRCSIAPQTIVTIVVLQLHFSVAAAPERLEQITVINKNIFYYHAELSKINLLDITSVSSSFL